MSFPTLTIEDLFKVEDVKKKWVGPSLEKFKPGTVRSYCGSVVLFLEFITVKGLVDQQGGVDAVITQYRHISKTLRRKCQRRRTEIEAEALRKFFYICNV